MLENQLIISMPQVENSTFDKVVVFICEHNENGAVGLIVNQPTDFDLNFIFEQLDIEHMSNNKFLSPVLFGGPVQPERGFVIHSPMDGFEPSLGLSNDICVSTSQEILRLIASGDGPQSVIVTLGYAGWGAMELDQEIKQNYWLTCDATEDLLYNTPYDKRWQKAIELMGIDLSKLALISGSA